MKYNVLRSHLDEFDIIWLADCEVHNQTLTFGFGYFHKWLKDKTQVVLTHKGEPITLELPTHLVDLEERRIVLNGAIKLA